MKRAPWIILLVIDVLSSSPRAAENGGDAWWPQFRGPNSSGLGGGKPPVHFGLGQNVLWKAAVGSGLSSPIVWGQRVFLTEFDQTSQKLATLCIDRRTGKILWRRAVETGELLYSERLGTLGYYYASPVAADQKIYIASAEGVMVVLDAGEKFNVLATYKLDSAILATPALVGGNIYVRTESHLYAFGN